MKKSGYKYQIEQELIKNDWEITEIGSNTDWWDEEHWKVALSYNSDVSFCLNFILDPESETYSSKGKLVYEVLASTQLPKN